MSPLMGTCKFIELQTLEDDGFEFRGFELHLSSHGFSCLMPPDCQLQKISGEEIESYGGFAIFCLAGLAAKASQRAPQDVRRWWWQHKTWWHEGQRSRRRSRTIFQAKLLVMAGDDLDTKPNYRHFSVLVRISQQMSSQPTCRVLQCKGSTFEYVCRI